MALASSPLAVILVTLAHACSCAAALRVPARLERRNVLQYSAAAASLATQLPAWAAGTPAERRPVLVLGANGGTGDECVKYLLAQGRPCIAATRTGEYIGAASASPSSLLTVATGDVTKLESMSSLISSNLGGVIYAASASRKDEAKKTSTTKAVDRDGMVTCAKLCIEASVPRFVVVSSGGVSKPTSAVYLFLNVAAGGIMDAKISGENTMRRLYAAPGVAERGVGYTVVRPGGLTREPALGVSAVELNQGDEKSGRIARADVAAICVESLASPAAFDTTFECYYGDTAKSLGEVFGSNARGSTDPTQVMSGSERRGETWPALFDGLRRDV